MIQHERPLVTFGHILLPPQLSQISPQLPRVPSHLVSPDLKLSSTGCFMSPGRESPQSCDPGEHTVLSLRPRAVPHTQEHFPPSEQTLEKHSSKVTTSLQETKAI